MKRCSECHFTFTDDDQVCDFDGTQLTEIAERTALAPQKSALRRLLQSQGMIVVLVLVGLVVSALLIGYYDALSQTNSSDAAVFPTEDGPPDLARAAAVALPQPSELPNQIGRLRTIDTGRGISAGGKPERKASGKRPRAVSRPRSFQSHVVRASVRFLPRNKSRIAKRKRDQVNSNLLALNRKGSMFSSIAPRHGSSVGAVIGDPEQPRLAHHQKDSKLVAVLKTTGRILKWPFQF